MVAQLKTEFLKEGYNAGLKETEKYDFERP